MQRRKFLELSSLGLSGLTLPLFSYKNVVVKKPIVISTWDAGIKANKAAWEILSKNGTALDAVEKGVMITEDAISCCVGLGANPDRDGFVTLMASIMIHNLIWAM